MSGSGSPAEYEIRVEGVLDRRWTAWFEGLQLNSEGKQTVIAGLLPDQAALHGLLVKVRDLGLCLHSVRRLDPLNHSYQSNRTDENGRELMPQPPTLTGHDIAEAQGAVRALLDKILADTATSNEYVALRVLAVRGPAASPAALHEFLAGQRQLQLDPPAVAELLGGLEARGLVKGSAPDHPGPTQLTADGTTMYARLADAVTTVTTRLYADCDPDDLATAHRVLAHVIERANQLRGQL